MKLQSRFHPLRHLAAPIALASLGLSGCVGSLEDPESFSQGTTSCPADIEVEALFAERCGGSVCHGAGADAAAGLDLESPGVAERMVGAPAQECAGWELVVPDDPESSFLLAKLESPPPGCGDPMPIIGSLSEDELDCVRDWIASAGSKALDPVVDEGSAPLVGSDGALE